MQEVKKAFSKFLPIEVENTKRALKRLDKIRIKDYYLEKAIHKRHS